jgi:acyl carrier protein
VLTAKDIRDWLARDPRVDLAKIEDDTPLFSSGTLDSFTMVEIMTLIEEKTGRALPAIEVSPENVDTINGILALARRHEGRRP